MHEKNPLLKASVRERVGTRYSERYRKQGFLPAVIYGHKLEPLSINIPAKDSLTLFHKGEKVFRIEIGI